MTLSPRILIAAIALGSLSCKADPDKTAGDSAAGSCTGPAITEFPEDQSLIFGEDDAVVEAKGTVCGQNSDNPPIYTWTVDNIPVDSAIDTGDLTYNDDHSQATFTPDAVGTYVLSIVISDVDGNLSEVDVVVITVSSGNAPPVAECGDNVRAEANQRVDFDGSASADPEGARLEYSWALSGVPTCSALVAGTEAMYNGGTANPSMVPDCVGVFVIALAVSDGETWSESDYCTVTVGSGNDVPIADAGVSSTLSACTTHNYELNGYGSYDPEGLELSYQWTLVSVPSGSNADADDFDDDTLPNPTFRWDVTGEYTFQLQVHDGTQFSPPDIVTKTFVDETENNAPTANAGADQTIDNEPDCTTASYVFTCDDCPADEADLDGSASDDPIDGDELDFVWTEPTGELILSSSYSPSTTVTTPSFPATYNTTTTRIWTLELSVSDCADTDTDSVTVTYTCTGAL